ncbi:MAG: hypothetical protein V4525_16015 [Pseudomonadota bacterium]
METRKKGTSGNESIPGIAKSLQVLSKKAVAQYTPLVKAVIQAQSEDQSYIERLFDGMLDFCFDEDMLQTYKKLCRYYLPINPIVTATHISLYRSMWEPEGSNKHNDKAFTEPFNA